MKTIAYFGPQGTFTEQAAITLAGEQGELRPFASIPATLAAVRSGDAEAGCVPVENSVDGAVPATMDALAEGEPLVCVAEAVLPIRFAVLARRGVEAAEVRSVASHPVALAQVRDWLAEHLPQAQVFAASSTAGAASAVLEGEFDAAVCAEVATSHYDLDVLATDVADVRDALTRFMLVRKPGTLPAATGSDRTSVVAVAADTPGSLSELLVELAVRGANLTMLEARPTRARLGEYRFYIDVHGHISEPRIGEAISALRRRCPVRFLGSYPRAAPPTVEGERRAADLPAQPGRITEEEFDTAARWLAAVRNGETA